jgi:hypothetical protein
MTIERLVRMTRSWSRGPVILGLILWFGVACSPLPSKYIEQAEPGVTLARLTASPQQYRDKVVIMGGVLVEERQELDRLWLRLKNRCRHGIVSGRA